MFFFYGLCNQIVVWDKKLYYLCVLCLSLYSAAGSNCAWTESTCALMIVFMAVVTPKPQQSMSHRQASVDRHGCDTGVSCLPTRPMPKKYDAEEMIYILV